MFSCVYRIYYYSYRTNGVVPDVSHCDGETAYLTMDKVLTWDLPILSNQQTTGLLEFKIKSELSIFPIQVTFQSKTSLFGVDVTGVLLDGKVDYSTEYNSNTDGYLIT